MRFFDRLNNRNSRSEQLFSAKTYIYLTAFFLPVIVMLCVFAGKGIYPFGDNSFLRTDLYHQYAPFFAELSYKLKESGSLLYTWDIGMGTNFIALLGYYLSSPFNWLVLLVPQSHVIEFVSYLVIFKIGLCGLTFACFLCGKFKTADYATAFFAVLYALSGYVAAYSWNVMWLDCLWLTPLILLGIDRLAKEGRGLLYCLSLALAILTNYYISIMICIFSVVYFLMELCCQRWNRGFLRNGLALAARCLQFGFYSLLAGGLAAVLLIPEFRALGLTASSDISFPEVWSHYFSVIDVLGRHLINVDIENGLEHWPNIYCGIACLLCLPLYFLSRRIPVREKVAKGAVLVFMIYGFSFNIPNFIWHGFHYPNSLPCRQSFLYIALLLSMCYEGFRYLRMRRSREHYLIWKIFFGAAAFIFLCEKLITAEEFSPSVYYISLIFLGAYALLAWIYQNHKTHLATVITLTLVVLVTETTMNMAATSVTTVSRSTYVNYTDDYRELIGRVQQEEPSFCRYEKYSRKTKNDGAWTGYPSISTFSSTSYGAMSDFYKTLGMESSMNAYSNNGITPLLNVLFNVRYILSSVPLEESLLTTLRDQAGDGYLYENTYALSCGYMLPEGFEDSWDTELDSPIAVQNQFANLITGDSCFREIHDTSTVNNTMSIYVDDPEHLFVEVTNSQITDVEATIGDESKSFSDVDRGFLLDLGVCYPEDTIMLTASVEDDETATPAFEGSVYSVDQEAVIQLSETLAEHQLDVTAWSDDSLAGTIQADDDGLFLLSIPYDPGWTLYVDGVKTEYHAFKDALLCAPLSAGKHQIELRYRPQGLNAGIGISLASLAVLLLLLLCRRFWPKRRRQLLNSLETFEQNIRQKLLQKLSYEDPLADEEEEIFGEGAETIPDMAAISSEIEPYPVHEETGQEETIRPEQADETENKTEDKTENNRQEDDRQ